MPVTIKILLDQYTEILRKIYGSHLKTVILYGSYARGDYRADSDIDIMILLDLSLIHIYNSLWGRYTFNYIQRKNNVNVGKKQKRIFKTMLQRENENPRKALFYKGFRPVLRLCKKN